MGIFTLLYIASGAAIVLGIIEIIMRHALDPNTGFLRNFFKKFFERDKKPPISDLHSSRLR
jgi:hypothetical protein